MSKLSKSEIKRLLDLRVPRWRRMEEWLTLREPGEFNARQLALDLGIDTPEASGLISAYVGRQRNPHADTLYVLKREGRTTAAVWSVGHRRKDANTMRYMLFDDVLVKVRRAFEPDMRRLAALNPRQAQYVEEKIEVVTEGAMKVLASAVDGAFARDDE